jgi:hypothetical protein
VGTLLLRTARTPHACTPPLLLGCWGPLLCSTSRSKLQAMQACIRAEAYTQRNVAALTAIRRELQQVGQELQAGIQQVQGRAVGAARVASGSRQARWLAVRLPAAASWVVGPPRARAADCDSTPWRAVCRSRASCTPTRSWGTTFTRSCRSMETCRCVRCGCAGDAPACTRPDLGIWC